MAKRKQNAAAADDTAGNGDKPETEKKIGFTGHHRAMLNSGHVLVMDSRPRNRPYRIEEWLGPDRTYKLVKATDGGQLTRFVEQQQTEDGEELGRTN